MKTDMKNSPFTAGADVAFIRTNNYGERRITKAVIVKVRKDGKFYLSALPASDKNAPMFTPKRNAARWVANESGVKYGHIHLEPWSERHDEEIAQKRELERRATEFANIQGQIKNISPGRQKNLVKLLSLVLSYKDEDSAARALHCLLVTE